MELEFIEWLRHRLPAHPSLLIGAGDDAAVLRLADRQGCVVTVDMLTDGVDFVLPRDSAQRVGRKSLAVNLSDLAAMAARPVAAVVAVALPRRGGFELAKELFEGLIPLAERYGIAIAGGDTNTWDGPLVISVTAIGETTERGPLCRWGAMPGDAIIVTGKLGGSILGHHFDFEPRVREALTLTEKYPLRAAIDVSDGLSLDLWRLASASGCGAAVELEKIPIAGAAVALASSLNDGVTPLDHALSDGEDFELVVAVPPDAAERLLAEQPVACGCTQIGQFVAETGLWQLDAAGARVPLLPRGYEHRMEG
jgi:thiamine-monophosphate kinase